MFPLSHVSAILWLMAYVFVMFSVLGPYTLEAMGDFTWVIFTLGLLFIYHWLPLQLLAMVIISAQSCDCNVLEMLL